MASSIVTVLSLAILALSLVTASAAPSRPFPSPATPMKTVAPPLSLSSSHKYPLRDDRTPPMRASAAPALPSPAQKPAPRVEYASIGSASSTASREATSLTKTFDQRQQGQTNIQAHLENIVLILVPSNRISITDFAAKTEPEFLSGRPAESQSELKSAQTTIDAAQSEEFPNSITELKEKPQEEKKQTETFPEAAKEDKGESREKGDEKSVQMDSAAKKFPFQLDTQPLEIPVVVIHES